MLHLLAAGGGYKAPGTEEFEFPGPSYKLGPFDFTLNRPTVYTLLATVLVFAFFVIAFRRPKLVPRGFQNFVESVYDFIRNQIVYEVIGERGERFTPYLTTLFCFIFVMNIYEIIPGIQFPATSRIAYPVLLAIISWLVFNYVGIKQKGVGPYFKEIAFLPGVPKGMYILLTPIEIFSTLIVRPFTLAIRLFANMFAGHLLLLVFFTGVTYLLKPQLTAIFAGASFVMAVLITGFELIIDLMQAYIFTILTAVYIAGAIAEEH